MTDEQAERIASTLERIEQQNERMIQMFAVVANVARRQNTAVTGQMTYYFNAGTTVMATLSSIVPGQKEPDSVK